MDHGSVVHIFLWAYTQFFFLLLFYYYYAIPFLDCRYVIPIPLLMERFVGDLHLMIRVDEDYEEGEKKNEGK